MPVGQTDINRIIELFPRGKAPIFPMYNFYIGGHGYYPKNLRLSTVSSLKTINLIDLRISNASIAGISVEQFKKFINFCTNQITTNFLYYSSCYAGDINLLLPFLTTYINEYGFVVSDINRPNFIIASGSIGSIPVITQTFESLNICIKNKYAPAPLNFFYYFLLLEAKTRNATKPVIFSDSELAQILQNVTPKAKSQFDPYGVSALPSVLFPHTDNFRAIPLNNQTAVISNVTVRRHEQEKTPLVLSQKQAILFYPPDIPITINIIKGNNGIPAIVSMIPGVALHKIDTLKLDFILNEFAAALTIVNPIFDKYFYIKKIVYPNVTNRKQLKVYDVLIRFKENNSVYILTHKSRGENKVYIFKQQNRFVPEQVATRKNFSSKSTREKSYASAIGDYFTNQEIAKEFGAKEFMGLFGHEIREESQQRFSSQEYLKYLNAALSGLARRY